MGLFCIECAAHMIQKYATFNYKGLSPMYCVDHRAPTMVNTLDELCLVDGCRKQANFNFPDVSTGNLCAEHRQKGMVDKLHKKCAFEKCLKEPSFNFAMSGGPKFCGEHKEKGMKNVRKKGCAFNGACDTSPSYNYPNKKPHLYCDKHKLEGMVNKKRKNCKYTGCNNKAHYNYPNVKGGEYCLSHMLPGMVSKSKKIIKCKFEGECKNTAYYNVFGSKNPLFCYEHKIFNMSIIHIAPCEMKGCYITPCFNFLGEIKGRFCVTHQLEGMRNVVQPTCEFKDCMNRRTYGYFMKNSTHCKLHREEKMIFRPSKKCTTKDCKNYALYGYKYQTHCEIHKLETQINMIERKCSSCSLCMPLNELNLCEYCGNFLFKKVHLSKQTKVKDFFDANELKYCSYDRPYNKDCGLERPDFIFDCGSFVIVVEVDENQHKSYQEDCECTRMVNIHQGFGGLKVIFIRYNPDDYIGDQYSESQRLNYLVEWVKFIAKYYPVYNLSFIKLFFDGFKIPEIKITEIPTI